MDAIYQEIVKWSADRPLWLRDALRRLVLKGELEHGDYQQLIDICKAQRDIPVSRQAPKAKPLLGTDVPNSASIGGSVSLLQIHNLRGINRLSEEADLNFQPLGLNVIYGDNGAGKSGFVRVLKKICRARESEEEEIYQNVFSEDYESQSAQVIYSEGKEQKTFEWEPEEDSPSELSAVSVFDSKCASVHVDDMNDLAYQPFGLDLMTKVAGVATTLNEYFRDELNKLSQNVDSFDDFLTGTQTRSKLERLNKDSSDDVISVSFSFTAEASRQLRESRRQLAEFNANNPDKKILELNGQMRRLTELNEHVGYLIESYSKAELDEIVELREKLLTTEEAAEASRSNFKDAKVRGIGTDAWNSLWEAARHYFEHEAYPKKEFPVDKDIRCVLCHQELSADAKKRLKEFETYVKAEAQTARDIAREAMSEKLEDMDITLIPDNIASILKDDVPALSKKLGNEIKKVLKEIRLCKKTVSILSSERCTPIDIEINDSISPLVKELLAELTKERDGYNALIKNRSKTMQDLESKVKELGAAEQASRSLPRIKKAVAQMKLEYKLRECLTDTATTRITTKANELSSVITDDLCQTFDTEAKRLDVGNRIDIKLEPKEARKGVSYHQIVLSSATEDVPVSHILSEGEHRAIALASFLTELTLSSFPSAIVLDDPVSSLDHKRRDRIAQRLAEEGSKRQVIIFTHDLRFVFDLKNAGEKLDVPMNFQTTFASKDDTGRTHEGLPFDGATAEQRLRSIRADLQDARARYNAGDMQNYNRLATQIYTDLRKTWERAVELNLLSGVVTRFNRDIHTKQLPALADITEQDCADVEKNMSRCSEFAHDAALEGAPTMPAPDEVAADIETLDTWIKAIKARREKKPAKVQKVVEAISK